MGLTDVQLGGRVAGWRKRRNLSQAELAECVSGMTQPKLSKAEKGQRRFTTVELAEVAFALQVDPLDLLESEPLADATMAAARGGRTDTAEPGIALAIEALRVWRLLEGDSFDVVRGGRPRIHEIPPNAQAEGRSAAALVRDALSLGFAPIPDLLDVAASVGMVVIYRPFDSESDDSFDGVCVADGNRCIAIVNTRNRARGRQRFTLAHEIGHWVFGDVDTEPAVDRDIGESGSGYIEQRANAFAAALLVPHQAAVAVDSVESAIRLAYDYRVSIEMMANRLSPALAAAVRSVDRFESAVDAGCGKDYQDDRDAQGRTGLTGAFELVMRKAQAAGAVSQRRVAFLLPTFDV